MRREPRLQFTKEERENPALEKPIRKVDRAADRADEAQVKVPKRKVKQRTVDPETGAVTVRLQFEDKKPPSKLQHALRDAPADTVLGAVHREVRQSEADNVGVESAHKTEEAAESAGRLVRAGYRSQKLRPYRKAAAAERKLEKANVNALYAALPLPVNLHTGGAQRRLCPDYQRRGPRPIPAAAQALRAEKAE